MIGRRLLWTAPIALLAVVLSACSGGSESTQTSLAAQASADLVAAGEPLYQASCAQCHGADLRGTALGPSHLSVVYEPNHHGDAAFVLAARNGVRQHHWPYGDMPPSQDSRMTTLRRPWPSSAPRGGFMDSSRPRRDMCFRAGRTIGRILGPVRCEANRSFLTHRLRRRSIPRCQSSTQSGCHQRLVGTGIRSRAFRLHLRRVRV